MLEIHTDHQKPIEDDINLRDLLIILWRRKFLLLFILFTGAMIALVSISLMRPEYRARATLLLQENKGTAAFDPAQMFSFGSGIDSTMVTNQIEVMRSRTTMRQVITQLGLLNDPEFNERIEKGMLASSPDLALQQFKALSLYGVELDTLPPEVVNRDIASVINRFSENLNIRPVPGSHVLHIEFSSYSPKKAALIANKIADTYIDERFKNKRSSSERMNTWLDERLKQLRNQIRKAEERAEAHRAAFNLSPGGTTPPASAEKMKHLNAEITAAKTQRLATQTRLEQIRSLDGNPQNLKTVAQLVDFDVLQRLRIEQSSLETDLAGLAERYGEKHPEMIKARSALREVESSIRQKLSDIEKDLAEEVAYNDSRISNLESELSALTRSFNQDSEAMITLRALEGDVQAALGTYSAFLQAYQKVTEHQELQEPEAQIISYAVVPQIPFAPNKKLILILGLMGAGFAGLILVIILEKINTAFRSAEQLEKTFNIPCLALIPFVKIKRQDDLATYVVDRPASLVAEAIRTLRLVLQLRSEKEDQKLPQIITITSSVPNEGKTTLSLWMARLAANSGEKVIIIDTDLRRPKLHRAMATPSSHTLVEYLKDQCEIDDIIVSDFATSLDAIFAKSSPQEALDLLASKKMKQLVSALKQMYDVIIIDTPASLSLSDARVLATLSDHLLYVVEWNKTPRSLVGTGLKAFKDMGFKNMACVLSRVHSKTQNPYNEK